MLCGLLSPQRAALRPAIGPDGGALPELESSANVSSEVPSSEVGSAHATASEHDASEDVTEFYQTVGPEFTRRAVRVEYGKGAD